jgi:hypothetical protein
MKSVLFCVTATGAAAEEALLYLCIELAKEDDDDVERVCFPRTPAVVDAIEERIVAAAATRNRFNIILKDDSD